MESNSSSSNEQQQKTVSLSPKAFEVEVNVSPTDERQVFVAAKLRKPTLEEDYDFARNAGTEYRDAGKEEEIIVADQAAAERLFDRIAEAVKGYRTSGEAKEAAKEWREASSVLALIPGTHKAAFVRGMRISSAKYLGDDDDCFVLGGGGVIPVELTIGYPQSPLGKIVVEIPEPTESERAEFEARAMRFLQGKGEHRKTSRTTTDMKVCFEFFVKLMQRDGASITGGEGFRAVVNSQEFAQCSSAASRLAFLQEIDPVYAVKIIGAAMVKYAARLQD